MSILPKAVYIFNKIPIKILTGYCRNRKYDPKIHMMFQSTLSSQNILQKEEQIGGPSVLNFKIYYNITVIKTLWYCYRRDI